MVPSRIKCRKRERFRDNILHPEPVSIQSIVIIDYISMANIANFDLNLLRVLDALLQYNSTVRAAEHLGLSQPAVSAALGRLRAALGDDLFFRRGQGLEPTHYALSLRSALRETIDLAEVVIRGSAVFDPANSDARFRISGSDFFAEMLMPKLADRLTMHAPKMTVHLVDLVPDSYVDTLDRYDVDLALIPKMSLPDWVEERFVFNSPFCVIARAGHPRLKRAGLSVDDTIPLDLYCDIGHVLFSPEGKSTAMGDAALAVVGRERRIVMTLPVFSGVYRAVAGSDLIALLPEQLARRIAQDVGLDVYRPPMAITPVKITMIWHKRNSSSLPHLWLRDQIADILAELDIP